MPTISCVCTLCGNIFYSKDELYLPTRIRSRMRFANSKSEIRTWEDWLLHISYNCESCRLKEIPEKCMQDFNKTKGD